jgi:hypothetical protein
LQVLRLAPAASTLAVIAAPIAVSTREPSQERILRANLRRTIMAITLGTFTFLLADLPGRHAIVGERLKAQVSHVRKDSRRCPKPLGEWFPFDISHW